MKKITLLSIAVVALSFASCKKDRTCTCTQIYSAAGSTASEYTVVYKKTTKSHAKGACMSMKIQPDGDPTSDTRTCTLK